MIKNALKVIAAKAGRESRSFELPGFRVALQPEADQPGLKLIASLPGVTIELCNELQRWHAALCQDFSELNVAG
jgi:hypothetical protein